MSCRNGRCKLHMSRIKRPPNGVEWWLGERGASSAVVLVSSPRLKIKRTVPNSLRLASQCDVRFTFTHQS
ncbi:hypothetical protein TNCV_5008001 [Trichonephila clavipes]|nr:hypothetical protein TNCV_5008001 [Trichonephila clavipes]